MSDVDSAVTVTADFAERLEIFFGEASDTVAHVYARLPGVEAGGGLNLSGSLIGPSCMYGETLPARFGLVDRGPGKSLLAEAIVPEPCFWTPDMPHLYHADVELRDGSKVLASVRRDVGIRTLGAAGSKLIYDGKRWVLRAVSRDEVPATGLDVWRESSAAMFATNPADDLCEEASLLGVLIVAELDAPSEGKIRRLSRWPAVGMVVLRTEGGLVPFFGDMGHNLLLAQRFAADEPVVPAKWAQIAVVEVGKINELAGDVGPCRAAVIAMRRGETFTRLAAARAACDRLQRDLAGRGDWAGYIV